MTNWYIFFVVTGQEESIANQLNFHFQNELFTAFVPLLETLFKKSGRVDKEIKVMFPGYVFVEAELGEGVIMLYVAVLITIRKLTQKETDLLFTYITLEKQERSARYYNIINSHNCLLGDVLERKGICHITALKNNQLNFEKRKCGKPYLTVAPYI